MIDDNFLKEIKEISEENAHEQNYFIIEQTQQLNVLQHIHQKHFYKEIIPTDNLSQELEDLPKKTGISGNLQNSIDEVCVGSSKTFEEILEEKLTTSADIPHKNESTETTTPTKRPFLRKGEGLKRFLGGNKSVVKKMDALPKSDYSSCSSAVFAEVREFRGGDTQNDLKEFEAIEEILDDVSFVSVTPSVNTKIKELTKKRSKHYNKDKYEDATDFSSDLSFEDDQSWGTLEENQPSLPETKNQKSASAIVKRFFPQLGNKDNLVETTREKSPPKSRELSEKIEILEKEHLKLDKTNEELQKLKIEKQKELNRLKKEIGEFEDEKKRELEKLENYRKEEMNKINKERKQFNCWMKSQRENPSRVERQQIEELENKIKENENNFTKKEKRWNCSLLRLKDRIDILEKENNELKGEIKIFERFRYDKLKEPPINVKTENKTKISPQKRKDQGTRKVMKSDGNLYSLHYTNGDEKHKFKGNQLYYYSETGTLQLTFPSGEETILFPNGQIERKISEDKTDILFADTSAKFTRRGQNIILQKDGTFIRECGNGEKFVHFASGHVVIESSELKRTIYPDGRVKTRGNDA